MCIGSPDFSAPSPPAQAPPPPVPGVTSVRKRKPAMSGRAAIFPLRIPRDGAGVGLKQ